MDEQITRFNNIQVAHKMISVIFNLEMDMKRVLYDTEREDARVLKEGEKRNMDMIAINTILVQKKQLDIQMEKLNLCRFCRDNKIKRAELELVKLDMIEE
jgi:hypothetical protein